MFVVCRTCASSYHIPDEMLGDDPAQSRCSQGGDSWRPRPPATLTVSAASTRDDAPARFDREPVFRMGPPRRLRGLAGRMVAPLVVAAVIGATMTLLGAREAI